MDNALEQMKLMSSICELYVLIELSPDSLKSTVVDFTKLNTKSNLNNLQRIELYIYILLLLLLSYIYISLEDFNESNIYVYVSLS